MKTHAALVMNVSWLKHDQVSGLTECFSDDCSVVGFTGVAGGSHCIKGEQKETLAQEPNYKRIFLKCYTESTEKLQKCTEDILGIRCTECLKTCDISQLIANKDMETFHSINVYDVYYKRCHIL